jgi:hypothetical protein
MCPSFHSRTDQWLRRIGELAEATGAAPTVKSVSLSTSNIHRLPGDSVFPCLIKAAMAAQLGLTRPFQQPKLSEKLHLVEIEAVAGYDAVLDGRNVACRHSDGPAGGSNGCPVGLCSGPVFVPAK